MNEQTSPAYGKQLGYQIFYFALRWFGPRIAYFMLLFVIPYYVLFCPNARKSARPYLDRYFPGQNRLQRLFRTFRYFYEFGLVLVDQAAMSILGKESFKINFPGQDDFYNLARNENGLVLLTTHAGSWQTAIPVLGHIPVPVHLIFKLDPQNQGRHVFDFNDGPQNFHFIDPESFLGGMVEATDALRKGHCVATMGDRAVGSRNRPHSFLGSPTDFPMTPYYLALTTSSTCCVLLTARTGKLSLKITHKVISDGLDDQNMSREDRMQEMLRRYVDCLEEYVKEYPFGWYNFFLSEESNS